ncbi:amidohydrolase [Pseudoalteromonas ulvae]|uniref:Hydrolase n=1 Tax=Pseudoalteromonas ulvae TaxID=107327 RepID=A0A244CMT8_PSEDV|nr:amidohydrolase [Pseudoalteromonas ulvae]OUL56905.1 hydrolase [Pseudoalteromonas ulvae]
MKHGVIAVAMASLLLTACGEQAKTTTQTQSSTSLAEYADVIYYGGDILTMATEAPSYAEAIATQGEKIIYVGDKHTALTYQQDHTQLVDLQGQTLMPGFIDSHSHVYGVGLQAMVANVLPPPDGQASSVEQLVQILISATSDAKYQPFIAKTNAILGFGYDDAELDRYPTKADLDKVSTTQPVIIIHTSGHLSVANSVALKMAGINANTENPKGGVIRKMPNSDEPNGVLEENAHFALLFALMKNFDVELQDMMLEQAQQLYAKYGYTTAQEGRATQEGYDAMDRASKAGSFVIDVVAYADMATSTDFMDSAYNSPTYTNQFRIGGVKLNFDGSPQGKTAWLTHPYHIAPEGQDEQYAGYATFDDQTAFNYVETAFKNNWQVLTHANGDAAIEQFIDAVEHATNKLGKADRRPVLIHGQTIRQDQVARLKDLGIFPSLFPMHTFYWGDWHVESVLGHPRADFISPTQAVLAQGLMFTSHHDAPVALPDSFRVLDATVNRTTRTKQILGADQRVEPYTALKALTSWAAYQYFEQDNKGMLKPTMQADLIILSANPVKVPREEIKHIKVHQTISRGQVVYQASQ